MGMEFHEMNPIPLARILAKMLADMFDKAMLQQ